MSPGELLCPAAEPSSAVQHPLIKSDGDEWDMTPAYMIQIESSHYMV